MVRSQKLGAIRCEDGTAEAMYAKLCVIVARYGHCARHAAQHQLKHWLLMLRRNLVCSHDDVARARVLMADSLRGEMFLARAVQTDTRTVLSKA